MWPDSFLKQHTSVPLTEFKLGSNLKTRPQRGESSLARNTVCVHNNFVHENSLVLSRASLYSQIRPSALAIVVTLLNFDSKTFRA